jgi:predicted lipoprotein with Yx(FWY)xxD motif
MRIGLLTLVVAVGVAAGSARAAPLALPRYPAAKMQVRGFGSVLASSNRQALYYWSKEKPGTIRCTGSCAAAWPPLYVPKGVRVTATMPGLTGRFGTIRRADGRRQLTRNGRAVYSYVHEGPGVVLCDDVDGWFVVRL